MNVAAPLTSTKFATATLEPGPWGCLIIETVSSCIDCGDVTGAAPPENATLSRSFEPSHTVATCACSEAAAPTCDTPCPKPARTGQKFWLSPLTSALSCTN